MIDMKAGIATARRLSLEEDKDWIVTFQPGATALAGWRHCDVNWYKNRQDWLLNCAVWFEHHTNGTEFLHWNDSQEYNDYIESVIWGKVEEIRCIHSWLHKDQSPGCSEVVVDTANDTPTTADLQWMKRFVQRAAVTPAPELWWQAEQRWVRELREEIIAMRAGIRRMMGR